jgi:hypothetical protein
MLNGAAGIPFYCTYFAHHHILICFFYALQKDGWLDFSCVALCPQFFHIFSSFCSSWLITIGYHIPPPNSETPHCRKNHLDSRNVNTIPYEILKRYPTNLCLPTCTNSDICDGPFCSRRLLPCCPWLEVYIAAAGDLRNSHVHRRRIISKRRAAARVRRRKARRRHRKIHSVGFVVPPRQDSEVSRGPFTHRLQATTNLDLSPRAHDPEVCTSHVAMAWKKSQHTRPVSLYVSLKACHDAGEYSVQEKLLRLLLAVDHSVFDTFTPHQSIPAA